MESELVGARGSNGMFARCDPGSPSQVSFDRTSIGPHEEIELSKEGDKYKLRFKAANVLVSFTPESGIETRPADGWGAWEQAAVVDMPTGRIHAFVEHTKDGNPFTPNVLILEVR